MDPTVEAGKEKVTLDDKGRVLINGKVASDSAIEQRLRRYCSKKKEWYLEMCPRCVRSIS
jgi:translation initiation factor 2 beta subunit (eIF-2beta)/eIF-5